MGKKSLEDKIASKRKLWLERTATALNISEEETERLLHIPRRQSIRLNPLIADPAETLESLHKLGWSGKSVEWCPNGYTVEAGLEAIRDSELSQNGSLYIQNSASWLPVLALNPQPEDDILDVCAAPGGKTSHMAAIAGNQARITANDNSKPRLAKLRSNLSRMGVKDVYYTMYDAAYLSHKIYGRQYDKILLDAPCSGEGMMTIDSTKDFESWSVPHIKRLQQLQKKLIVQAWQLLKPGGTLIYSTCTMAPEENEAVIDYLLRHNKNAQIVPLSFQGILPNRSSSVTEWNTRKFDSKLAASTRLHPSVDIEAFYICRLEKLDSTTYSV